jgi:hypothetical protein
MRPEPGGRRLLPHRPESPFCLSAPGQLTSAQLVQIDSVVKELESPSPEEYGVSSGGILVLFRSPGQHLVSHAGSLG